MPATINKQRLLTTLFTALKKHYGEPGQPPDRPVLGADGLRRSPRRRTRKEADKAFDRLPSTSSTGTRSAFRPPHEVEEVLAGLPHPAAKAQRVIALLQEVFESTFSYDLEGLQKKGLKQAAKQIGRYQAADDYTVAWVTQQSLGGHAIPVDRADPADRHADSD